MWYVFFPKIRKNDIISLVVTKNTISPNELYQRLRIEKTLYLLDIRDEVLYDPWHIDKSQNIPLKKLKDKLSAIPKEKDVITICNRGNDSKLATKMLLAAGYKAFTLERGLMGWNTVFDIVEIAPEKKSSIKVYQVKRLGKGCLSYIVILPDQKSTVIIDPAFYPDVYLNFIKENKLKLKAVLDTHLHVDHVSGARRLSKKYKVPYLLPDKSKVFFKYISLDKGLGKLLPDIQFEIIPTPGHTKESVSILLENNFLFSGDTLLIDIVGRTDLGDHQEDYSGNLYQSVKEILFTLNEGLIVLPSHTSQSLSIAAVQGATLRYVRRFNEINDFKNKEEYMDFQIRNKNEVPANYVKIKKMNLKGTVRTRENVEKLEFGNNFCGAASKN